MINTCLHCTIKSVRKYKHPRIIRNHSSLFDPTCSAIIDSNTINNTMAVSNIKSKTRKRQNHRKLSNKLATLSSHTNNESSTLQVNGSLFNPSPSAPFLTLSSLTQPATTTTTTTTAIPTTKPNTIPNTITTTTPTPTTADSIIYDDSITMNEMPKGLRGYYSKRFSLFSLFDKGIQLDHEGWFSVTPEVLAVHIAKRCTCDIIIDAFCGVGGNTIQFAKQCKHVYAIDNNRQRLDIARHNARVYGVDQNITFILGDVLEELVRLKADCVFLSPPWGGPGYKHDQVYDMETMVIKGSTLIKTAKRVSKNICFFMPKNTSIPALVALADVNEKCELEYQYLNDKPQALCAYYGELLVKSLGSE